MLEQIYIGSAVTLLSLVLGAVLWWGLNETLDKMENWIRRPPHPLKSVVVIIMVVITTMAMMTMGVWLWAGLFVRMSVFPTLEEAAYYSLVAYTTLGLGDVVVPEDRRLLGGMTGANGFLMFGLMTAMLTDTLRHTRKIQHYIRD